MTADLPLERLLGPEAPGLNAFIAGGEKMWLRNERSKLL